MTRNRSAQLRTRPSLQPLEARDLPSFLPPVDFIAGQFTRYPAVADMNKDGKRDVVVALDVDRSVALLLGNGNGTLQPALKWDAGDYPLIARVADLNTDGKPDMIVGANEPGGQHSLSVFLGNGNGSFQPRLIFAVGTGTGQIGVGDFNGDGKPDLAIIYNAVHIFIGKGDGSFENDVTYNAGPIPLGPEIGDVNHDGFLDVVVVNAKANSMAVVLNRGDGTFKPPTYFAAGDSPACLVIADVNKDAHLDVVVGNGDVINFSESTFSVLLGNGDGTFRPKMDFLTNLAPDDVVVADFNRDRKLDVAILRFSPGILSVMLGNGDGTFGGHMDTPDIGYSFAAADMNQDRLPDLVVAKGPAIRILTNDATWPPPIPPIGNERAITTSEPLSQRTKSPAPGEVIWIAAPPSGGMPLAPQACGWKGWLRGPARPENWSVIDPSAQWTFASSFKQGSRMETIQLMTIGGFLS